MFRLITLLAIALLVVSLFSPANASLRRDIDSQLATPDLAGAVEGIEVVDIQSGKILYQHDPAIRLMPASNRKLFTSAAALELLGDDYCLKTTVVAASKPDSSGTIIGDLYLKGGGDSLLSSDDLDTMAKALTAQGVKRITGDVVGDGSFFQGDVYGDGWAVNYLSDYYAPEITGLELAEGVEVVSLAGGAKPGDPVGVTLYPPTHYISLANTCVTGDVGSTADISIYHPVAKNEIDISGSVPPGYKPARLDGLVTVENPPLFAATVFNETLQKDGIQVDGAARTGVAPANGAVLAEHDSVPMSQYIRLMNKPSDNLMAESLVRDLGAIRGKGGSFDDGRAVEQTFFERDMGIVPYDLVLYDGSGLSRLDMVTARAVVSLLVHMAHEPDFKAYYDSLPIAGVDGTLRSRMRRTIAAGNVHAKTGTVAACHTISGYVTTRGGRLLAFSMLMNNFTCPTSEINKIQDAIALRLANEK